MSLREVGGQSRKYKMGTEPSRGVISSVLAQYAGDGFWSNIAPESAHLQGATTRGAENILEWGLTRGSAFSEGRQHKTQKKNTEKWLNSRAQQSNTRLRARNRHDVIHASRDDAN
jgi:hypothetical protein